MPVKTFSPAPQKQTVMNPDSVVGENGSLLDVVQSRQPQKALDQFNAPKLFVDTGIRPEVFSAPSGPAPFETLFDEFELQAVPHFNFWTSDEATNDRDELGDRKLEDVPRYVVLSWKTAPDLPDPAVKVPGHGPRYRPIDPVTFSSQIKTPKVFSKNGVSFAPEHLGPDGFQLAKSSIANGFYAPGTVEAVVSLPGSTSRVPTAEIDEDAFLSNPAMAGISVHELRAQAVASAPFADSQKLTVAVGGQFSVQTPGSSLTIRNMSPRSPGLGVISTTAVPSKPLPPDPVMDAVAAVTAPDDRQQSVQAKVKFFDPAVTGILSQQKLNLMTSPEHVESLATLAPVMANLQVLSAAKLKNSPRNAVPPAFASPRLKPLEYIGYVIEKYAMGKTGVFTKVDEFDIPSREADTLVDTKVLYGATYRYRIRAYLRWTRPHSTETDQYGYPVVTALTASRPPSRFFTGYQSSYFASEWNHTWAYASVLDTQPPGPPDELTVRPESHRKRVAVTCKLPDDSQLDINVLRIMRKTQGPTGEDASDWREVYRSESAAGMPSNVMFFDYDVDFYTKNHTRYVYCAQCLTRHGESSVLSEQIGARLNDLWRDAGELPVDFVSCAGVKPEYFGAFKTIPPKKSGAEVISPVNPDGSARVVMTGKSGVGRNAGADADYICRITSLDTGEHRDYDVSVVYNNLPPKFEPPLLTPAPKETFSSYSRDLQTLADSIKTEKQGKARVMQVVTKVQSPNMKIPLYKPGR